MHGRNVYAKYVILSLNSPKEHVRCGPPLNMNPSLLDSPSVSPPPVLGRSNELQMFWLWKGPCVKCGVIRTEMKAYSARILPFPGTVGWRVVKYGAVSATPRHLPPQFTPRRGRIPVDYPLRHRPAHACPQRGPFGHTLPVRPLHFPEFEESQPRSSRCFVACMYQTSEP